MATLPRKYRTGITTEQIVDAAVKLTQLRGLYGWTIRDLVARIGTSPSVVYHRVGGRDALCRRVVSRVLAQVEYHLPSQDDLEHGRADWRDWFRATFFPLRPVLIQYPGVAKWILMHGRPHSENFEQFDAEIDQLHRAGFGDDVALVYALIFTTALNCVMMSDERNAHEMDDPRDHSGIIADLRAPLSQGSDEMIAFIDSLAGEGAEAQAVRDAFYRTVIDTILDGLEQRRLRGLGQDS
jgi:AcrR family transcriptional regulator